MNKISSLLAAGGLLLVVAAPAFATFGGYNFYGNKGTTVTNMAYVDSSAAAVSNTGNNSITSGSKPSYSFWGYKPAGTGTNTILTGAAGSTANSLVQGVNQVTGSVPVWGSVTIKNSAMISSDASATSNSGMNTITSGSGATNTINTGAANSTANSTVQGINVTGF